MTRTSWFWLHSPMTRRPSIVQNTPRPSTRSFRKLPSKRSPLLSCSTPLPHLSSSWKLPSQQTQQSSEWSKLRQSQGRSSLAGLSLQRMPLPLRESWLQSPWQAILPSEQYSVPFPCIWLFYQSPQYLPPSRQQKVPYPLRRPSTLPPSQYPFANDYFTKTELESSPCKEPPGTTSDATIQASWAGTLLEREWSQAGTWTLLIVYFPLRTWLAWADSLISASSSGGVKMLSSFQWLGRGETLDLRRSESSLLTDRLLAFLFQAKRLERLSTPCALAKDCLCLEISLVSSWALMLEMSSSLIDCSMLFVKFISQLLLSVSMSNFSCSAVTPMPAAQRDQVLPLSSPSCMRISAGKVNLDAEMEGKSCLLQGGTLGRTLQESSLGRTLQESSSMRFSNFSHSLRSRLMVKSIFQQLRLHSCRAVQAGRFILCDYSKGCVMSPQPWTTLPLSFPSSSSNDLVGFSLERKVPLEIGLSFQEVSIDCEFLHVT